MKNPDSIPQPTLATSLTTLERVIMSLLVGTPEPGLCGKELVDRADGALKMGSIYVTLQRMQAKSLVESERENPSQMSADAVVLRRFYTATQQGRDLWNALNGGAASKKGCAT